MMRMGAWEVDFSGNVNAFFTNGECDSKNGDPIAHGWACGSGGEDKDFGDVRDGLLPSWFNFSAATTTDNGIRTAVHLSFQPGTDTNSGFTQSLDGALGQGSTNFRQVFLTFGNESMGTIKLGRDLGVFGSDAILQDMTLLGVGSGAQGRGHTTLGRIGVGYLYADWKAQVQYASPKFNGFSFTAALVDPWGVGSVAGTFYEFEDAQGKKHVDYYSLLDTDLGGQEEDTYGFEAKVNYNMAFEAGTLDLWASYIRQDVEFRGSSELELTRVVEPMGANLSNLRPVEERTFNIDTDATADGFDIGAKIAFGSFDIVGYYYDGEGIGTTSFLLDGIDATGQERDSDGYYLQLRYRAPSGTLFGASIGESTLDETAYDVIQRELNGERTVDSSKDYHLLDTNESWIVGVYHPLGEALNLVVEYTNTESESHSGNEAEEDLLAIGAIMFF